MRRVGNTLIVTLGVAGIGVLLCVAGVMAWNKGTLFFWESTHLEVPQKVERDKEMPADIDQAIKLLDKARTAFADVKDYRCIYLRDEFIDNELKENLMILKVRHDPFSVYMEWLGPKSKKNRKAAYIEGQNDNKVVVKDLLTIKLDPKKSIEMKESRHTILEAGLRNMMEQFQKGWAKEKELKLIEVTLQDATIKVKLPDGEVARDCVCVTTVHDPKHKNKLVQNGVRFRRTLLYFDKETSLPIRMEGYDWPKGAKDREGQLLERYTYLNIKTNLGLADKDFKW